MEVLYDVAFPASPIGAGAIRRSVEDAAVHAGISATALEDLRLAVSEAISNAVLHAYTARKTPGPVYVTVLRDGRDWLSVVVRDEGRGPAPRPDSPGLGMGLSLIAKTTAAFHVEAANPTGTRVSMRFALSAGGA